MSNAKILIEYADMNVTMWCCKWKLLGMQVPFYADANANVCICNASVLHEDANANVCACDVFACDAWICPGMDI